MEKQGYIAGIKVVGLIIFFYGLSVLIFSLPILVVFVSRMSEMKGYRILLWFLGASLIGFFYFLSSFGILRLKKWGRSLSIYNSYFALFFSIFAWISYRTVIAVSPYVNSLSRISLLMIFLTLTAPALFFLLFMISSKIKEYFQENIIQESRGVTVFIFLFITVALLEVRESFESFSLLLRISQPYITVWFWTTKAVSLLGLVTAAGLLFRKDIFRKMAISLLAFDLFRLVIEVPFINRAELFSSASPITVALFVLLNVIYDAGFIYFFTRPKVKEQFK